MHRRTLLLGTAGTLMLAARRAKAADRKKVSLWHIYSRSTDMIHAGIAKFNARNTDFEIEPRLIPYTQVNPELLRAAATGSPPDLVTINDPDVTSYAAQGQLTDLTDRVAASKKINMSLYYKGLQASGVWKGRRFSVAREINTLALYYNADLFRAAGLDPDKPPKTWNETTAAAAKLTDKAKTIYGLGFCAAQSEQSVFQFLPWLWQAGGSIDKLDQPPAAAALQYWTDMVAKGYASRDVIIQPQVEVMSAFGAGSYAMAMGGPWELPRLGNEAQVRLEDHAAAGQGRRQHLGLLARRLSLRDSKGRQGGRGRVPGDRADVRSRSVRQAWNQNGLMAPRTDIEVANPTWPQAYAVYREQVKTATPRGPHPQWPTLSRPLQHAIQEALTGTKTPMSPCGGGGEDPADPRQDATVTTGIRAAPTFAAAARRFWPCRSPTSCS